MFPDHSIGLFGFRQPTARSPEEESLRRETEKKQQLQADDIERKPECVSWNSS